MTPSVLRAEQLTKRYGKRTAVRDISFTAGEGEVVALLGANGAGKTTTLKCILGITSFEGSVEIGGRSIRREGRAARRLVGYVPQLPAMSEDDRIEDALRFIGQLKGAPASDVDRVLEAVRLSGERRARVGELSGGMRQRIALAAALLGDPRLLLLDEPTASLDAESRTEFENLVREQRDAGRAVLLSTHALERTERFVDRALVLHNGALVFDGRIGELRARVPGRRLVITVNDGAGPEIVRALSGIGVGEERIAEVPASWDEILRAVTAASDDAS